MEQAIHEHNGGEDLAHDFIVVTVPRQDMAVVGRLGNKAPTMASVWRQVVNNVIYTFVYFI